MENRNKVFTNHSFISKDWLIVILKALVFIYTFTFFFGFIIGAILWFISLGHIRLWNLYMNNGHFDKTLKFIFGE